MKKFGIYLILCLAGFLTSFNSRAQGNAPQKYQESFAGTFSIQCADEWVEGTMTLYYNTWDNKAMFKVKGVFTGVNTGKEYTYSLVQKSGVRINAARNSTFTETVSIVCEGAVIGTAHMTYHWTYNAEGKLVVSFDKVFSECF